MSDRITRMAQNHPANLRREYEEDELETPPGFPPPPPTRNWFFSQPSSSSSSPSFSTRNWFFNQPTSSSSPAPSSSYISAQLNTTVTLFSADGTATSFNYDQPRHFHLSEQTNPYQVSPMPSISQVTPLSVPRVNTHQQLTLTAQPISCVPPWATDIPATSTPHSVSQNYQFSAMPHHGFTTRARNSRISRSGLETVVDDPVLGQASTGRSSPFWPKVNESPRVVDDPDRIRTIRHQIRIETPVTDPMFSNLVPHTISQEADRSEQVIRAQPISSMPHSATDRHTNMPQPMSPGVGCSVPQVATHSLPEETHETHAQHAASTSESGPQVTIRRSDPNRVMTPEEIYAYVFFSPEWRIEERVRENGKFRGKIDYLFENLMIPKQFRSLKSVGEYLRTNKIHKSVSKRRMQNQKAHTMDDKGESDESSKRMKPSA